MTESAAGGKIRIGVVGIGFGQQVLVPAFRTDARCEVALLCASSRERAAKAAAKLEVPRACGDWREVVDDPDIDALAIATPATVQPDIARAALQAGKPVFCEKPLAVSVAAAEALAEAAREARVANMVDFEFREVEPWRKAKAILVAGGIGSLRHLVVSWNLETYANRMKLSSWKTKTAVGGGVLHLFTAHTFYYLEWLAGEIRGLCARLGAAPGDQRPGDTLNILSLEFASGAVAAVTISSQAPLGNGHRLEFYGSDGALVLDNPTKDYINGFRLRHGSRAGGRLETIMEAAPAGEDGRVRAVGSLTRRFVDWITTGATASPTIQDGLRVQRLMAAAQRSHQERRWIEVQA